MPVLLLAAEGVSCLIPMLWFYYESLESEAFVDELEEAVKYKKIKRKKDAKKTFHDELLEMQKQKHKVFEESEKRFQAFQFEMLEKQLSKHLCRRLFCKRDSSTDVFLWILWNFLRTLIYGTPTVAAFVNIFFTLFGYISTNRFKDKRIASALRIPSLFCLLLSRLSLSCAKIASNIPSWSK